MNVDKYCSNNERSVTTGVGAFLLGQRNAGYADNDGRWVVSQLPELYWSTAGVLRQRRPGVFLGVFDTEAAALTAIEGAGAPTEDDRWVESIGQASC